MWRLADYQGQLIANLIVAGERAPRHARRFARCWPRAAHGRGAHGFVASDRHRLEVNYYDYRRLLRRLDAPLRRGAPHEAGAGCASDAGKQGPRIVSGPRGLPRLPRDPAPGDVALPRR